MTRRWFGTDGIRGVANSELSAELALAVGRAAAQVLSDGSPVRVLIGRDTRQSGTFLEAAVAAGIASAGGEAVLAGIVPTPAVSRLVVSGGYQAGVVISASHNPYHDNGIKLLGPDGRKLPDAVELQVEAMMECPPPLSDEVGTICSLPGAAPAYTEDLLKALKVDLSGMRVMLDCAQGAMYQVAPLAFRAAGAYVEAGCCEPDGSNINRGCGSTDLGFLAASVAHGDFDLGLAFDGDGDRVLAVDAAGEVVDGDKILAILGTWLREQGRLANDTVVVTSMSNLGFHRAMAARAIHVEVTDVGDRYVLERMLEVSAVLGGEQSGHVILLEAGPTGDGLQTGLLLAQVVRASGRTLAELAAGVERFPQLLVNVRVGNRDKLKTTQEVWEAVAVEQRALGDEGRIVLRPSGTEPLVRVMVEAPSAEVCREVADRLALTVERALS